MISKYSDILHYILLSPSIKHVHLEYILIDLLQSANLLSHIYVMKFA